MRVLLVSMPFAALNAPSAALSLLKAQLTLHGVSCDVAYLGMALADLIGDEAYEVIVELPAELLAGEWVFASCMSSRSSQDEERYFRTVARCLRASERSALESARAAAFDFLAAQLDVVPWREYDVIGFTSSCEQNLASLAMARLVKECHPQAVVVFGGANWEAEMGSAQLELASFVDVAFLGESDLTLPLVVDRLSTRSEPDLLPLDDVPGIGYRDVRGIRRTPGDALVEDLDTLAAPDFSDFFAAVGARDATSESQEVHLWLQGSRGCWWAEYHPCRFCGLNGTRRAYRTMSPRRFLDAVAGTVSRWPGCHVDIVDMVVSEDLLDEGLPELVIQPLGVPLSLEVRPEIRREQVGTIAKVGGEVQIGIESLSDDTLRLMGKGTRALECLRLLKWCRAEGLRCSWNILFDIPGEGDEHILEEALLIPALHSLPAPTSCIPMQLDRFSPFFEHPASYGIEGVRPAEAYSHVYPWSEEDLASVAYTFDFSRERGLFRRACIRRLQDEVKRWQEADGQVELSFRKHGRKATVVETRTGVVDHAVKLDELDSLLYAACDSIAPLDDLVALTKTWAARCVRSSDDAEGLARSRLQRLVDERILVEIGGRYLSLALADGAAQGSAA